MKAVIDNELCIGCVLCTQTCPEVFEMNGEKAIVHATPVPEGLEDLCQQAADECPVTAITIEQ
ncbi:MAG: ferredoxin [Candidatus Margulisbacteria bacterium]|nr:ferredoxin [Candidatus Margulisiibacteriota bacterium]